MTNITYITYVLGRVTLRENLYRFAKQGAPPISPEPWDEEAEQLARAVADLSDEMAVVG